MIYKGNVDHIEAKQTIHKMTENGKIRFAEWSPTAKIWRDFYPLPPDIQSDEMVVSKSEAVMLANNTGITRFLNERITKKVDKLYSQKHIFIGILKKEWKRGNLRKRFQMTSARIDN